MSTPSTAAEPVVLDETHARREDVADWLATGGGPPTDREPGSALAWIAALTDRVPPPGAGRTILRWEFLAQLGRADLVLARAVEPHLDALAILSEAGIAAEPGSWAVWAAEGPGMRLAAERGEQWTLTGGKPWCSLAGDVDHALVTAWVDDSRRALFAVDLASTGVEIDSSAWSPLGLEPIVTSTVRCDGVAVKPVGDPEWYLRRPGFAWGGIGVAAIWLGAATAVADQVLAVMAHRDADTLGWSLVGAIDAALWPAQRAMASAAATIDAHPDDPETSRLLAARVRQATATAAETVLTTAGHALGPGPLTTDERLVNRVRDLQLYLRQHHAERDAAALGRLLRDARGR
ncbi:acyl-CoA dehydrogenase [Aeromicrobium sp. YIM 150415]|uniref:acyl-CoA dehydrogenase n=1 Tax=Aeromicrobium sp. YIM 150415 TaxID=2803912 RepID=UPI0019629C9E|nr:acyl-CoA dehydrogenase [Aeromicrobium sp. YIM 150415]MBM9462434.1 acyl-CoA dehydrogenase [Aeromicrobium sp. YIM 150415]